MSDVTNFTPEQRVTLVVGGRFTPDTFGPEEYREILAAIVAMPGEHMDAFEALFVRDRPTRRALTELHLEFFLGLLRERLPERVTAVARRLESMMASLARHQAGEAAENEMSPVRATDEIARQQRQLARRREGLAAILGRT
jgi:hypothetical protein